MKTITNNTDGLGKSILISVVRELSYYFEIPDTKNNIKYTDIEKAHKALEKCRENIDQLFKELNEKKLEENTTVNNQLFQIRCINKYSELLLSFLQEKEEAFIEYAKRTSILLPLNTLEEFERSVSLTLYFCDLIEYKFCERR